MDWRASKSEPQPQDEHACACALAARAEVDHLRSRVARLEGNLAALQQARDRDQTAVADKFASVSRALDVVLEELTAWRAAKKAGL